MSIELLLIERTVTESATFVLVASYEARISQSFGVSMRLIKQKVASFGLVCLLAVTANAQAQPAKTAPVMKEKAAMEKKADKAVATAPVDLNSATAAELESVKGIGPATSKKIIAGRPYSSVADLKKLGLSAKQLSDITPMLKVGGAAAAAAPAVKAAAKTTETAKATKGVAPAPTLPLAPGGGKGLVWVNEESKVFHREGDRWYGRTKKGKYMTEAQAAKAGAHESKEKMEKK